MSIPLLDLNRQFDNIKGEVEQAISKVLDSQYFIMGKEVEELEETVRDYCSANNAYGCASGSDALLLSLMAIDLQPGDYVITSPFTFFATAGAISRLGGIPVFLDIEKDSYNIDPEQVKSFLEGNHPVYKRLNPDPEKIKAIIPVHLYGQMADMNPIMDLADKHNLYVIEDAAQAIGAEYKGKRAGSIGDFGCFSFFPSKNLGAYGDGGLITVKDPELAEKTDILRLHGAKPKYHHSLVGINSRLDALQAAILSVKMKYLDDWSDRRSEIAGKYTKLLQEIDPLVVPAVTTGNSEKGGRHIYHQYTLRTTEREKLIEAFNKHDIGYSVYYPISLHEQECFAYLGYKEEDCPEAHKASSEVISIPIFPELSDQEITEVVSVIKETLNN